jgi:peptidoglycan/LPS O-acetylase OafA/YrhL
VDYKDLSETSPLIRVIYAGTGFGHQAVMVFFVLSGFFIGRSVLKLMPQWSWFRYLGSRLTRLYLVLIPALVLTAIVDQISMRMPGAAVYFFRPIPNFDAVPLVDRISPQIFLGNLAFLQTISVAVFGSASPLWSLANEFWYYVLFPLLVVTWCASYVFPRIVCASATTLLLFWLPSSILYGFLIWLMGAALNFAPRLALRRVPLNSIRCLSFGCFATALILVRLNRFGEQSADYAVGIAFALWMYTLLWRAQGGPSSRSYSRLASLLASCSYSVYAVHLPLLILIRVSVPPGAWQPTSGNLLGGVVIGCGAFAVGYLLSRLTEAKTEFVRCRVFDRIGVAGDSPDRAAAATR